MRFCVPLYGDRVAPRCTVADGMVFGVVKQGRITYQQRVQQSIHNSLDLMESLCDHDINTLVCGGISRDTRESIESCDITIIPNVTGKIQEVLKGVASGSIRPGIDVSEKRVARNRLMKQHTVTQKSKTPTHFRDEIPDCINCIDKSCLVGEKCTYQSAARSGNPTSEQHDMLEVSHDISAEEIRQLCRLSELVYFCLEMGYKRIGIAFCVDLLEPARTLTRVLSRFFTVFPVCCRINQETSENGAVAQTCNPVGQAAYLNKAKTDINVIIGLSVGADCVFNQLSEVPVTTLFVKDKALANNPIGAVYSERYLDEASHTSALNHSRVAKDIAEVNM